MISKYLGFDLAEYHDANMNRGIWYGFLGAFGDVCPWFLATFSLPYVYTGGNYVFAALSISILGIIFFCFGVLCQSRSLNANFNATYSMVSSVRLRLANHLAKIPMGRILSQRNGAWAELLTTQFSMYQDIVTGIWSSVIAGMAFPAMLWLLLLWLDWLAALVILISIPLALLSVPFAFKALDSAAAKCATTRQIVAARVLEVIVGVRDLRYFDLGGHHMDATLASLKDLRDESLRAEAAPAPALSLFSLVIYVGATLAIGVASVQLIESKENAISGFITLLVILRLAAALNEIGINLTVMRFVGTILKSIRQVFDEPVMPQATQGQIPLDASVHMQNIVFSYENNEDVIKDVSLTARSGDMIALVGLAGSGKSTIASLIARLWDVNQGKVCIGGVDVKDMDEATLHKTVSIVLQDVVLFPMSVADNIALGKPQATQDDIIEAAKLACIHERIMQLPKGYETILESREVILSGGERQRVAIARAILKDAPVLILDEVTASLDAENRAAVQHALTNLSRDKTTFIIAHCLCTIQDADKIYVMHKGKVVESGSHAELLENQALYAKLWEAQNTIIGM